MWITTPDADTCEVHNSYPSLDAESTEGDSPVPAVGLDSQNIERILMDALRSMNPHGLSA